MELGGFTGTLWEAVWPRPPKECPKAVPRLLQAGPGWSRAGPHCKGCMFKAAPGLLQAAPGLLQAAPGCSRVLQAAPGLVHTAKVLSLLQAAPGLLQAAPVLLQAVQSWHWARVVPRPPKGYLWSPKQPKFCFWANSGPNAADGCPRFPSEAALELPQGCPQADILPQNCPQKLQTKDHKTMHIKQHRGSCGCPPTTHKVDGIANDGNGDETRAIPWGWSSDKTTGRERVPERRPCKGCMCAAN